MQKIDARGRICPLLLFYTKRKIEGMQSGEELEVIAEKENYFRIVVRRR